MSDRAIVVTGAARGMGRAHALAAAELDAHVCVTDVLDAACVVDEITRLGGSASAHELDVVDADSWLSLAQWIDTAGLTVTGLVNNAGISFRHGFADTALDDWSRVLNTNLTGAFLGIKTMAPRMAASGGGAVVNIASIAGRLGYFSPSYGASKWGLIGLTKSAAGEWADHGVRVNAVLPGLVNTPLLAGADDFVSSSLQSVPMGRSAEPEEVARAVKFLLSEDSTYISGAELLIDGAMTSNGLYKRILDAL